MSFDAHIARIMGVIGEEQRKCESHGEFTSMHCQRGDNETWSGCPKCAEERIEAERQEELEQHRRKTRENRMIAMLGYACMPPRFADKSFDSYHAETEEQRRVLGICKDYADNFRQNYDAGTNLLMLGAPGTGKTHLAVAILRQVIEAHELVGIYTSASRMFRRIKSTFGDSEESETQALEAYTRPALLVLDEVGVSYGSDAELNYLFDIMNERYEQCLPTIIVSNIQPDEMGTWLGDRVVDRLRESSRMILFNWESARRGLAKAEVNDGR